MPGTKPLSSAFGLMLVTAGTQKQFKTAKQFRFLELSSMCSQWQLRQDVWTFRQHPRRPVQKHLLCLFLKLPESELKRQTVKQNLTSYISKSFAICQWHAMDRSSFVLLEKLSWLVLIRTSHLHVCSVLLPDTSFPICLSKVCEKTPSMEVLLLVTLAMREKNLRFSAKKDKIWTVLVSVCKERSCVALWDRSMLSPFSSLMKEFAFVLSTQRSGQRNKHSSCHSLFLAPMESRSKGEFIVASKTLDVEGFTRWIARAPGGKEMFWSCLLQSLLGSVSEETASRTFFFFLPSSSLPSWSRLGSTPPS